MPFTDLGLSAELLRAIADVGYTDPTPVQEQAIPLVLEGRDLVAAAQTGTGKTAAFALPILERLKPHANSSFSPARHPVRALILTPTRELAVQVEENVEAYAKYLPFRSTAVYGGVPIDPQVRELMRGIEILVATPGRLLDHVQSRTVDLRQVEVLVLDEGDRMLDMGFMPDVRKIVALLPNRKQTLLFSATFPDEVQKLAATLLTNPAQVQVAAKNTPTELVRQLVYPVDRDRKRQLLVHLALKHDWQQVLVFTRTKIAASRLAAELNRDGVAAVAIHSDRTQGERTRALADFKAGAIRVLVATDVAARGLDIEELPLVVNYELPTTPEGYIHRIGRTGRAGLEGAAISLVCVDEVDLLRAIQRMLKRAIPWDVEEGFIPDRNAEPRPIEGALPGGRGMHLGAGRREPRRGMAAGRR